MVMPSVAWSKPRNCGKISRIPEVTQIIEKQLEPFQSTHNTVEKSLENIRIGRSDDGLWVHIRVGTQHVSINLSNMQVARKLVEEYDRILGGK